MLPVISILAAGNSVGILSEHIETIVNSYNLKEVYYFQAGNIIRILILLYTQICMHRQCRCGGLRQLSFKVEYFIGQYILSFLQEQKVAYTALLVEVHQLSHG